MDPGRRAIADKVASAAGARMDPGRRAIADLAASGRGALMDPGQRAAATTRGSVSPVIVPASPVGGNPWLEELAAFGAEGDPAAEEARIAFAENLGVVDADAAAKLRQQVAEFGIGNVNDPDVFQWAEQEDGPPQITLVPGGPTPAPAGPAPAPAGGDGNGANGDGANGNGGAPAADGDGANGDGDGFEYVPPGGGPVAREIIETGAANQVGIVEQALEERGNAIADMVRSGMIDIQSAQDLYDRQRAEVYADFLGEQNRIVSQFDAERSAAALERATDRAALEAQLRAAGVNPGLVADEFAMMDEMYRGAGQEQADYLDAMGRIGRMSDAERSMIGEGIFGGYRQDLRSRGRELGLGAEFEATEGRQLARERALQAADLAPYLGVDPRAIASGLYSGVDIPGMTEAARGREWQTGERLGGQEWQTGERLGEQDWRTGERLGGQAWQTGERLGGQAFQAGESALDRGFRAGESALDRGFRAGESALARELSREELAQRASEAALDRGFQGRESALDRAIREAQLEEQIRQFGVGQDWQERQFGELSAAQLAQQAQDQARIDEQIRQFGVGQAWQERQFGELSEAQQQDLAIQQLAAGIDPATGEYLGFDPNDPYAAFSPQQRYQAMQDNQLPLVAVLAQSVAGKPEQQQKVTEIMSTLQTAAMGQPVTDDMLISALAADPVLQSLIPLLLAEQQADWLTAQPPAPTMGPSATGPLGPAPLGPAAAAALDPVDSNAGGSWWDPEGKAAEAAAQGAAGEGRVPLLSYGRYARDPADWITPSDVLRQNRQWGGREGAPMDRAGDFLTSVVGRAASAIDPMENIQRLRKLGGWFTGW